jgi:hypothetical protein
METFLKALVVTAATTVVIVTNTFHAVPLVALDLSFHLAGGLWFAEKGFKAVDRLVLHSAKAEQ